MIKKLFILFCIFMTTGSCGKKRESNLTLTISPGSVTLLNVNTQTCTDKATAGSTGRSATSSAAIFQTMSWEWKSTDRDLTVYALRFSSSDSNFSAKIDQIITGNDMASFEGNDPAGNFCQTCFLSRVASTTAPPTKYTFGSGGTMVVDVSGAKVVNTNRPCAPIVGGFMPATGTVNNFSAQVKVTLMAYSKDDAGNIENEYSQVPVTVRYEATPP